MRLPGARSLLARVCLTGLLVAGLSGSSLLTGVAGLESSREAIPGDDPTDLSALGPWARASMQVHIPTPSGGYRATVVFPYDGHDDATTGDPLAAPGQHPAIVFGHGYLGRVEWYTATLHHLASWGFVVLAPHSALELFPDQESYVDDFSRALDWLEAEDGRPGSWLEGRLAHGRYGASGHSMGGGASIVAAARDTRFGAVANLAAADLRIGAVEAVADLRVPLLLVAAGADRVTRVDAHQRRLFEAAGRGAPGAAGAAGTARTTEPPDRPPVGLAIIEGGGHCGFLWSSALSDALCGVGDIGRQRQMALSHRLLTGWFLYWLAGRKDLREAVWPATPEPGITLEWGGSPGARATDPQADALSTASRAASMMWSVSMPM